MHHFLQASLLLIYAALTTGAWAQPLGISHDMSGLYMGPYLQFVDQEPIDSDPDAVHSLFQQQGKLLPHTVDVPNFGFSAQKKWAYAKLLNQRSEPIDILISHASGFTDTVSLYLKAQGAPSGWQMFKGGESVPFESRHFWSREANFLLSVPPGESYLLVLMETQNPLQFYLQVWSPDNYLRHSSIDLFKLGLLLGFHLIVALYNLFLFASFRDRTYLFYAGFVTANVVHHSCHYGVTQFVAYYLGFKTIYNGISILAVDMIIILSLFYTKNFLNLKQEPRSLILLYAMQITSLVNLTIVLPMNGHLAAFLVVVNASFCISYHLYWGVKRSLERYTPGYYFLLAWSLYLVGSAGTVLTLLNLIDISPITYWGQLYAGALEVVLLSIALGARYNFHRELDTQNIRALNLELKKKEESLEREVALQTQDLLEKNQLLATQQQDLIEAHQKLKELDEQKTKFFQNVSHEIRTPLTLIINPLEQSVELDCDLEPKQRVSILKNARRLLRLVNQLLDFQKLSQGNSQYKLYPIHLVDFLKAIIEFIEPTSSNKGIRLLTEYSVEDPVVQGQADALEKVIFNYISNAIKYTPDGGMIRISIRLFQGRLRLQVEDSGPGIADADKPKIFRPFSRIEKNLESHEGTGIGLALVKELADRMESQVGVSDSDLGGACFFIDFKLSDRSQPIIDILIVDDEFTSVERTLQELSGWQCRYASSYQEAMDVIAKNEVRLVITDQNLGGESGIKLLIEVQAKSKDIYRILATGEADVQVLKDGINEAAIHKIFYKPLSSEMIRQAVEELLVEPLSSLVKASTPKLSSWHLGIEGQTPTISESIEPSPEIGSLSQKQIILVVDDLKEMRQIIADPLRNQGYGVIGAAGAEEAYAILERHSVDLIIADWMMPRVSGPEFLTELKKHPRLSGIPTVLLTARTDEESKLIARDRGASAYLGKPFNSIELLKTVENLLSLKNTERRLMEVNRNLTENVLKRFLPDSIINEILEGKAVFDQTPQSKLLTVIFADICSFTEMSEKIGAHAISRILNTYFTEMTEIVFNSGGMIDKFIGDGIMILMGAHQDMDPALQANRAVECATQMHKAMLSLSQQKSINLQLRIGIHQGPTIIGNFGSKRRSDYTAIGTTVNLASRLAGVAQPGQVLFTATVRDYLLPTSWKFERTETLKGISQQVSLFSLVVEQTENHAA